MAVFTKGQYNCACSRTICDWSCTTYATMMSSNAPNTAVDYVPPLKISNAEHRWRKVMYEDLIKRLMLTEEMLRTAQFNEAASLIKDSADAIEELIKPQWISVEDRLPNEGEYVLVTYLSLSGKMMAVSFWFRDNRNKAHWGGENELLVTHWMPLPEPPKEEGDINA